VGRPAPALRELRSLGGAPLHRLRGTDPNWNFGRLLAEERRRGASSTFFVLAGHRDRHDGASPETYDRLRPRLVQTILEHGGEVGVHGSYTAADDAEVLRAEREVLTALGADPYGHRYHYLRVDPHRNLRPLAELGFAYDTTLGWPDAVGFRGGIAHPFRPWDFERDQPLDLLELPLAAMDATLAESRYLGLSARAAWPRLERLLDWAAANGGGFSVLWHPDRFARPTSAGWDRLYYRFVEGVTARGGVCVSAAELAAQASSSHSTWSK
jgi:peptidoglycan/xylan/chitin deacetylase (PgdA/CDA1 family)